MTDSGATRVVIVGAGLIGLSTAYLLRRRGFEVTVVDRQSGPGRETSFANGALLTPSMSDPWNGPGSWRVLLASLGRSDAPLQLRMRALPTLLGWGLGFLRNSRPAVFERNTLSNLSLAIYSLQTLESLCRETGIDYGRTTGGALRIYRERSALEAARSVAQSREHAGLRFRMLDTSGLVDLEPALGPIADQLVGAIHYENDETGDAYRYCVAIAKCCHEVGVHFRWGTTLSSFEVRQGQVVAARCGSEAIVSDHYIVAAGSYSAPLLSSAGIRIPVRPAKGYSVTINVDGVQPTLRIPIVDDQLHAVIVPLEGAVRAAGTAEFAGYDLTLPQARVQNLLGLFRQVLPRMPLDERIARSWCGLRPLSADGVPIIGSTSLKNLWVNTGHGHLGWTLAAGSAQLLADVICGTPTTLDPKPYAVTRFGRS